MENKNVDQFINIAAGGKKLTGEIKRLKEIPPINFKHSLLEKSENVVSLQEEFNEKKEYQSFKNELNEAKKKFLPFLKKYSKDIIINQYQINDFEFKKEDISSLEDFSNIFTSLKGWKKINSPYYESVEGKTTLFFRHNLFIEEINKDKEYILKFDSVDYVCDVYLNSRLIFKHVGFFSPFEVDVTKYLKEGKNILLLVINNDFTTTGTTLDGFTHYGDKIYGATNIGTDEPLLGWHHCPSGSGIIGNIFLLIANKIRISDCFITPNIDKRNIKIKTQVNNYLSTYKFVKVKYLLEGRNFECEKLAFSSKNDHCLQINNNYIEDEFNLDNFKLWDINSPYLYDLTISLEDEFDNVIEEYQTHFGMRKFIMDSSSKPLKGAFYFNNKRIMLRGTNEMGHLLRDVMENNFDQLIEDILIIKITNLNFIRMTQRPTLNIIYDYFDMLGLLNQTDFPLFSYLNYSALQDAYKQVDEMERLTRNHPCVVIESICNETLDKTAWGKEDYVISRHEMEQFFEISKNIIHLLNPTRVIKYCEGDYAPLAKSYGISDFHCYTYWYISHGLPSGKLRKGYLPPIRKDYMCGCGEFGVDGLDSYEIMKKYAPKEWLPISKNDKWSPKVIAKGQCYALHGDFFKEEEDILSWINSSRNYQRYAIKEYVKSLRLRSDYIEQTAVHLLIDAWPMGWSKALIDVDRIPKPAYYAFKNASLPLTIALRKDKSTIYNDDSCPIEIYAYNDLNTKQDIKCNVSIYYFDKVISNYSINTNVDACSSLYLGDVIIKPLKHQIGNFKVVGEIINSSFISKDQVEILVKPTTKKAKGTPQIKGKEFSSLKKLCSNKKINNLMFVNQKYYLSHKDKLDKYVEKGNNLFISISSSLKVGDEFINFKTHTLEEEVRANNLIYPNQNNEYTKQFDIYDFKNFYNNIKGYEDISAWFKFDCPKMREILYTLIDENDLKYQYHKKHLIIMGELFKGKGKYIVSTLTNLEGMLGNNPNLDQLFKNIINSN